MTLATTAERVTQHTPKSVNEKIRWATRLRVEYYAQRPAEIPQRLRELDLEWDVERCLETGSASLTLTGLLLGTTVNKKWLLLSAAVQGFFLQHALQGWCPPLPLFRRMGVRTADEIAQERHALQFLQSQGARGGHEAEGTAGASAALYSVGL
jgi:hypothetical protein